MSELDVIVEIKAVMYKALDDDDNINKVVKSKIYMENKLTLKFYQKTPRDKNLTRILVSHYVAETLIYSSSG